LFKLRLAEKSNATQAVRFVALIRPADTFSRKREKERKRSGSLATLSAYLQFLL
jgi:hypothetical protein